MKGKRKERKRVKASRKLPAPIRDAWLYGGKEAAYRHGLTMAQLRAMVLAKAR